MNIEVGKRFRLFEEICDIHDLGWLCAVFYRPSSVLCRFRNVQSNVSTEFPHYI